MGHKITKADHGVVTEDKVIQRVTTRVCLVDKNSTSAEHVEVEAAASSGHALVWYWAHKRENGELSDTLEIVGHFFIPAIELYAFGEALIKLAEDIDQATQ